MPLPAGLMRKNSVAPPAFTPDFYVATDGSASNNGSIGSPWSLSYALGGAGGALTAGKIVAVRGGSYTAAGDPAFSSTVAGTASAPIIFRQYPGEHPILQGQSIQVLLRIFNPYVQFWGLDVAGTGSVGASDSLNRAGIDVRAAGCKIINCVVHDHTGVGISAFAEAVGNEVTGCICYNNGFMVGNTGGHNIYTENTTGTQSYFDNILFNAFGYGVHCYGETGQPVKNFVFRGNTAFNNSTSWDGAHGDDFFFSGVHADGSVAGLTFDQNYAYRTNPVSFWGSEFGYRAYSGGNFDLSCTSNYLVGATHFFEWSTATVANNVFYPRGSDALEVRGSTAGHSVSSNNTFYGDAAATTWYYEAAGAAFQSTSYTFASWKTQSGCTNPGPVSDLTPSGTQVFVRPNSYESGRGNLTIYNWDLLSTVAVNLSSILSTGQAYDIRNVQDMFGSATVSGTYVGGTVNIPMAAIAAPIPVGLSSANAPTTGPEFQAFVVRLQGA